jgi:UrcA family protein
MKAILTALWATVVFINSIPASAAEPQWETRSAKVDYSDLDLTGPRGISTLEHRVSGVVHQVCGEPAFDLGEKLQQRACERRAQTDASSDISHVATTARQSQSTSSVAASAAAINGKTLPGSAQQHQRLAERFGHR